jgi:outer membrane protein insertion porin family
MMIYKKQLIGGALLSLLACGALAQREDVRPEGGISPEMEKALTPADPADSLRMLLDKAKSQQGDSAATAIPVSSPADSSARPAASPADSALTAADSSKKDSSADAVLVNPEIKYTQSTNEYVIQDIDIVGNGVYDKEVLSAYSGLRVGQTVKMPGEAFSNVIKKFWKQGLFADVKIYATKIQGDKVWLQLAFTPRPRITDVVVTGMKKKDKEDIESGLGLAKGGQISPGAVERSKTIIKHKLAEKGYEKASVNIELKEDPTTPNYVTVYIDIDRKNKIKVHRIHLSGNQNISNFKLKWAMKSTKEPKIWNIFKSKKFIRDKYKEDKDLLLAKYNEKGYRDAEIISDSVVPYGDHKMDIYLTVSEGKKYYFRNISWTGNTIYRSEILNAALGIKKGDIYNQKLLNERLNTDDDAVSNLYMDNGYLFFNVEPVETKIEGDSIDMEMRIYEGRQAVINKVEINGNTAVYENVIRRELRTKPGALFSKSDLQRSARELAQTGQFDPEKMDIRPVPHPEDGTVDIIYNLEQKRNDQVELSFGWGSTGVTGSLGFKFTNFSIQNIFNKESYHPLPQGDGQTLSISYTTNADYYNSASISFVEPWLGGRRPTNLSTTLYWSKQTGVNSYYYNDSYYYSSYGSNYYSYDADPDKYITTVGGAVGIGTRLTWPDDYFSIYGEVAYRHYDLQNWSYFDMQTGTANNLSLGVTWSRNSLDNPYYTRRGSMFSLSLRATPPYSAFTDNKKVNALVRQYRNGESMTEDDYNYMQEELYRWVEYYKTEFKVKAFTPLTPDDKLVLMTRAEYGFLGYYDSYRRSPFERYYVGGDGTTGSSSTYATTAVGLRGYANGSLTPLDPISGRQAGNLYSKLSIELRYPLMLQPTSTIYVLAFADAGNAWSEFGDFDPFNLKRSIGGGVRIFLPMLGLIGVDYGYGFDEAVTSGDNHSNFHLVIGQEF